MLNHSLVRSIGFHAGRKVTFCVADISRFLDLLHFQSWICIHDYNCIVVLADDNDKTKLEIVLDEHIIV